MILRKMMSLIGVGSAQIDLKLTKNEYAPDELLKGYFIVKGGTIEQLIKRIDCDLIMTDEKGREKVIDTMTVLSSRVIQANEQSEISFSFKIPSSIPPSSSLRSYHFKTRLTFDEGMDSKDQDIIRIISP